MLNEGRYSNRILQITRDQQVVVRPKDIVTICERLDGSLYLELRSVRLDFVERNKLLPAKQAEPKPINTETVKTIEKNSPRRKTNHPMFVPKTRHFYSVQSHDIFKES